MTVTPDSGSDSAPGRLTWIDHLEAAGPPAPPPPPPPAVPLLDVQTAPLLDVQTAPLLDVQTAPLLDVQTAPLLDVQTAPLLDVQTVPLLDVQTAPPRRRARRRVRARHGELLAAAIRVFDRHGVEAATVADIAREAGLSKAALYRYFPTKGSIVAELQTRLRDQATLAVVVAVDRSGAQDWFARADAAIEATVRFLVARADELAIATAPVDGADPLDPFVEMLAERIRGAVATGVASCEHPEETARLFVGGLAVAITAAARRGRAPRSAPGGDLAAPAAAPTDAPAAGTTKATAAAPTDDAFVLAARAVGIDLSEPPDPGASAAVQAVISGARSMLRRSLTAPGASPGPVCGGSGESGPWPPAGEAPAGARDLRRTPRATWPSVGVVSIDPGPSVDADLGLDIRPIAGHIGAEIHGVDLSRPLDAPTVAAIRETLLRWKVVFFRDQFIDQAQHLAFAAAFGEPTPAHPTLPAVFPEFPQILLLDNKMHSRVDAPNIESRWHTDVTFLPNPPMASILRGVVVPPYGGDTQWTNLVVAYEQLSEPLRDLCDRLHAVHHNALPLARGEMSSELRGQFMSREIRAEHPVVRVHPETGERALFVNPNFTSHIVELSRREGAHLLALLYEQIANPEYTCRFRWEPGSIAFWDNRATAHLVPTDVPAGMHRAMQRITLAGDLTVGVDGRTGRDLGAA